MRKKLHEKPWPKFAEAMGMPIEAELLSSVRAIYFDLDDTLCGYWDACKTGLRKTFDEIPVPGATPEHVMDAWSEAFREFCPNLRDLGFYEKYLVEGGHTRVEQMRRTLARLSVTDEDLAVMLSDTYLKERHDALALFPDAISVLDKLKGTYPLGLITNGPADVQREEIRILGISHYFANVYIEGELGFGKPEPEVLRQAAEAVGFQQSELLFVGNSYRHDILPAIQAGWMTAWIRRPSDVPPSAKGVSPQPEELPPGSPKPTLELSELSDFAITAREKRLTWKRPALKGTARSTIDADRPMTESDNFGGAFTNSPVAPSTFSIPSGVSSINANSGLV